MARTYRVLVYRQSMESVEVEVNAGEWDSKDDVRDAAIAAAKRIQKETPTGFDTVDESFSTDEPTKA